MLKKLVHRTPNVQQPPLADTYWNSGAGAGLAEPDDGHYIQIARIDSWRSLPFQVASRPDPGDARQVVRQLIEGLGPLALDEGSGAVLDLKIDAWTKGWIHAANTQAIDNAGAIDVHHAQAIKFASSTAVELAHARAELAELELDHRRLRDTLAGTEKA